MTRSGAQISGAMDSWQPPPRITLTFSEHADDDSGQQDLRLEYSTDTTDLNKASKQARSLAQRHITALERGTAGRVDTKHYAQYKDGNILIKALAIDTSMLKVDKEKCSVFVKGEADYIILLNILRLPKSSTQKYNAGGRMIEVQIPRQIDYDVWQGSIGKEDELKQGSSPSGGPYKR